MSSWACCFPTPIVPNADASHRYSVTPRRCYPAASRRTSMGFPAACRLKYSFLTHPKSQSSSDSMTHEEDESPEAVVQDLRIPNEWLLPTRAMEESEWLRVKLHKWLDDEYCPEPTNVEISRVASESFYSSLMQKQTDVGLILLKMAHDLTSISYQESFHGAFSSANAAVDLILKRIETPLI